ncbi:MAG: cytochrome c oxidase assembly factor Coa1 family protein [Nitrospiraceae bacterium]
MDQTVRTPSVTCPSCLSSQAVPDGNGADPAVVSCTTCDNNLVLVPVIAAGPAKSSSHSTDTRSISGAAPTSKKARRTAILSLTALCLLGYGLIGAVLFAITQGIKRSVAYQTSVVFIQDHEDLRDHFGTPLEFGWFPTWHMKSDGPRGTARFEIPITGPRASGSVLLSLVQEDSETWHVHRARYQDNAGIIRPVWTLFPGDELVEARVTSLLADLDQAANRRDVEGLVRHVAPGARLTVVVQFSGSEQELTMTREQYRTSLKQSFSMAQDYQWTRMDTDVRLAPDGRKAVARFQGTESITINGQRLIFALEKELTFSLQGPQPLIVSMKAFETMARP